MCLQRESQEGAEKLQAVSRQPARQLAFYENAEVLALFVDPFFLSISQKQEKGLPNGKTHLPLFSLLTAAIPSEGNWLDQEIQAWTAQ